MTQVPSVQLYRTLELFSFQYYLRRYNSSNALHVNVHIAIIMHRKHRRNMNPA